MTTRYDGVRVVWLPFALMLATGLVMAPSWVSAQSSICNGGLNDGSSCSSDPDCWACDGGLSAGDPCGVDDNCPGSCELSGLPCRTGICAPNTCLGALFFPCAFVCDGGPFNGQECSDDSDCSIIGQCAVSRNACLENSECAENACADEGSCDNTGVCGTPLPVELTSFEAVVESNSVSLRWTTASELNNAGFSVELANKENAAWREVAFVEGRGSTISESSYSHEVKGLPVGLHRFRLRQVDLDGAFEYSPEVEALIEVPGAFVLEPAYPNPFNPTTNVRFAVSTAQPVVATLVDASGRVVRELYNGVPNVDEIQTIQVDGNGLASGVYRVSLTGEHFAASQQITLVK